MHKNFVSTPQSGFIYEINPIKGSRFIGLVFAVHTKDEVTKKLEEVRHRYIDATHHCYAYQIGGLVKSSDDGEPSGTAGKPILTALQRSGYDAILLVVVRYFGGTMLGAPGLIRAYADCAQQTLGHVPIIAQENTQTLSLDIPYELLAQVLQLCQKHDALIVQEQSDLLTQRVEITINTGYIDSFRQQMKIIDVDI